VSPPGRGKLAVVAVGGNALIVDSEHESIPDQFVAASKTAHYITDMVEAGFDVVITHGSGPQVGFILRRSEIARDEVPMVPMDYAAADIQGAVGCMFQRVLQNNFRRRGLARQAIAVVTQVVVDREDPAFHAPDKPIGSIMEETEARLLAAKLGWEVQEERGRGWRRVVPSPAPREIVELPIVAHLIGAGFVVIAAGGGGIPVVRYNDGDLEGVEAVVDKDLASSLLARGLRADLFIILTAVEKVAIGFGTPEEHWLDNLTVGEARRHLQDGEFPPGTMGPKIHAMIEYIEHGGGRGLITNPPNVARALAGETGTAIIAD
jgi:carbamate kinase